MWWHPWLCLTASLLLFGCTADVVKPVTTACPPIKIYDQSFQSAFANELEAMHKTALYQHVEQFMVDSVKLRQVLKACQ